MRYRNDPLENFYTYSEKNDRKYTIYQAWQSARSRLSDRYQLCVNAISGRANGEKITLQELNQLADQMVSDSKYYAGN